MTLPRPDVQYARSGDVHVAYAVYGDGPIDLVIVPGYVSHLEVVMENPAIVRFMERLTRFARVIGSTSGERASRIRSIKYRPLEDRMDDVGAVMDAVGSERASLLSYSEGGPMSIVFAATYPERVSALVLERWRARFGRRTIPGPHRRKRCSRRPRSWNPSVRPARS